MGAMLKDSIVRADIGGIASAVLVVVAVLFLAIAGWAIRADAAGHFKVASQLPLEGDEIREEFGRD